MFCSHWDEESPEVDLTRQRNWDQAQIVVQSLKSRDRKVLINGGNDARYSPTGHIVYALASTLWARPFDLARLQVIGEPASIVEAVRTEGLVDFHTGAAEFSFSGNGAMAYVPGAARGALPTRSLVLIDLSGKVKPLDLPAGPYHSPRFSLPDGKQIALYTSDGVIWIHDLSGMKPIRKLTPEGGNLLPMWTRGWTRRVSSLRRRRSGRIVLAARRWQRSGRTTDGTRRAPIPSVFCFPRWKNPFLTDRARASAGQGIVTLSLNGDTAPKTLFQGAKGDVLFSPTLSPDGRWLAYELRRANTNNIYVDPFPPTGVHYPVTTDGGSNPMWSPDGKRLFYVREARGAIRQGRE